MSHVKNNQGVVIQSVERAIEILQCFRGNNEELGITEIAEYIQLSKSTAFGLVNTLKAKGLLEQNLQNKKYRLGITLFELGNLVQQRMDIRSEAKIYCTELANKYDTIVHLAVHDKGEVIYIDKLGSDSFTISASQVGRRAPMYCTGVGKAMLAYVENDYIENYVLCKQLQQVTNNTITNKERLIEELRLIRSRGFAVDNEEIEIGLRCIAAPIFDNVGYPIAAISLSASYRKIPDKMVDSISNDVKYYAQKISERMGYNRLIL